MKNVLMIIAAALCLVSCSKSDGGKPEPVDEKNCIVKNANVYKISAVNVYLSEPDQEYPGTESFQILFTSGNEPNAERIQITFPKMFLGKEIDMTKQYEAIPSNFIPQWAVHSFLNSNENLIGAYYTFGEAAPVIVNNNWEPQSFTIQQGKFCVTQEAVQSFKATLQLQYSNGNNIRLDWSGHAEVKQF